MKVLVVENVKLFQVIISNLFESSDLEPIMEETGAKAIAVLQQHDIDVICISMYLSDMDGISLCKKIRQLQKYKYTPVILFTSETDKEVQKQALSVGITEIFNKQDDIQQLVAYIKRFTGQYQKINARILYVEDMASQRAFITAIFEEYGLTVDGCVSAEEAWECFQQHDYDLVVTDIVLEGAMSGIGLVNQIRRLDGNKGDVPILALTGFDDVSRRIELFHLGINDYVIKPVIQQEIIARVRNLINSYRAIHEQIDLVLAVFENSREGVFIASHNKTISSVNKAFVKITGFSEAEVRGKSPLWSKKEDAEKLNQIWKKVDQSGVWEGRFTRRHKNGDFLTEWLNVISIKNSQGIITHYIGLIHPYKAR